MSELKVKSITGALAIVILGIAATVGSLYIQLNSINVSVPLLILGALLIYLILNMLIYPKARTIQLIKISISSIFSFLVITSISYVLSKFLITDKVILEQGFIISANIAYYSFSVIFGLLTTTLLFKLDTKLKAEPKTQANCNSEGVKEPQPTEKAEVIKPKESEPTKEVLPQIKQDIENKPQQETQQKATVEEEFFSYTPEIKPEPESKPEPTETENIFETDLESLPAIELSETTSTELPEKESTPTLTNYDASIFAEDIPDDIRLSETKAKTTNESKGVITSIGKLLINHRDIENIIETNELMQQIGCSSEEVDIITMTSGIKIYEKFNKIMVEYTQVKDLTLSNKAGFTIASIIQNNRKSETVGAIASSAFLVLKNYLARLEINDLQKVFFETETTIHSLFKIDDFILFFTSEKSFEPVNYTLVKEVLDQNTISNQDLSVIKNIKGIVESAITDKEGMLIGSINSENPKKLASLSSAIFENLRVFITNIQPSKLDKITVFAGERVLTIRKYNDRIAGLITSSEGPIKLSDQITEIEELMK